MEYIGIIGLIALLVMFFYALKNHKSLYDEEGLKRFVEESRKEAYRLIQKVKNKRKQ